jgi:hypothetical protein
MSDFQVGDGFHESAKGDFHEPSKVPRRGTGTPFSDIRGNRDCGTAKLIRQAKSFRGRELGGHLIDHIRVFD